MPRPTSATPAPPRTFADIEAAARAHAREQGATDAEAAEVARGYLHFLKLLSREALRQAQAEARPPASRHVV
jgi:hypothetical protein